MEIGIIGYGSIGSILSECLSKCNSVYVYTRTKEKNKKYPNLTISELCDKCEIIFLCIKPIDFEIFMEQNKDNFTNKNILISIVSGISINKYQKYLSNKIFRIMTNVNININKGVMAYCPGTNCNIQDENIIFKLFENMTYNIIKINDNLFNSFTCIVGSGPAFISIFVDNMIISSQKLGFDENESKSLVLFTIMGTLVNLNMKSSNEIIESIASPGGITQDGINYAEDKNFSKIIQDIFEVTHKKSLSFSKEKFN